MKFLLEKQREQFEENFENCIELKSLRLFLDRFMIYLYKLNNIIQLLPN